MSKTGIAAVFKNCLENIYSSLSQKRYIIRLRTWKACQTGINESYDFRRNKKDGNHIWVIVNVSPSRGAKGNFFGFKL